MEAQQYSCVCVGLPSAKSDASATFLDDVQAVRSAITGETTQGRDVVVVVHSFGGLPGQSASKGLTLPVPPPANDASGHVLGFVVVASGFAMTGMSFLGGLGGKPPPFWKADTESGFAEILADPRELFFHDLPEEEGHLWVSKLGKQSLKALAEGGEHVYGTWIDVPSWYLATKEDKGFPIELQRMVVQMAKDAGADVTIREVESSHSPMLSRPKETADVIVEAVEYFVGRKG